MNQNFPRWEPDYYFISGPCFSRKDIPLGQEKKQNSLLYDATRIGAIGEFIDNKTNG